MLKWLLIFGYIIIGTILGVVIAVADQTQTNQSGSNTNIDGGYTSSSSSTTNYQSGSSSNTTANNTTNSSSSMKSAPATASAAPVPSSGLDSCFSGISAGFQGFSFGLSAGKSVRDKNCEIIKLSRELNNLGMKVASISILCNHSPDVFYAMEVAGSPCPANKGLIGKEAQLYWEQYPELRPDFEQYQIRQEQIKLNKQAQKQVVYDRYIAEAKK
tara:strand:- start:219 stop:863 length:645 start_codon:yes stop_codon:yes gene_type:complete